MTAREIVRDRAIRPLVSPQHPTLNHALNRGTRPETLPDQQILSPEGGYWTGHLATHERFARPAKLGFYQSRTDRRFARVMSLPKPGDNVKVTLLSGETIEGIVDWIDGNGAWVRGVQKSRWVPLEAFQPTSQEDDPKDSE